MVSMPARMSTLEIQSKDICCGLTPSWNGGQDGGGRRGGVKKLHRISFICYFPFVLEL